MLRLVRGVWCLEEEGEGAAELYLGAEWTVLWAKSRWKASMQSIRKQSLCSDATSLQDT